MDSCDSVTHSSSCDVTTDSGCDVAACDFTEHLRKILLDREYSFTITAAKEIVRYVPQSKRGVLGVPASTEDPAV